MDRVITGAMGRGNSTAQLKSDKLFSVEFIFYFKLWFSLWATTCLAGMNEALNLSNVAVFLRMGLSVWSINFTLFCLSVSGVMGALVVTATTSGYIGDLCVFNIYIDYVAYSFIVSWSSVMFVDLSAAITVFIASERCLCVVLPFRFNSSYPVINSKAVILVIVLFVILNCIPNLAAVQFIHMQSNSTVIIMVISDIAADLQKYNEVAFGLILSAAAQICTFVCAIISPFATDRVHMVKGHDNDPVNQSDETE
ncbi:hypothetical protein Btru_064674 [Bulinus truncatus]|nr:hypothetical protein Btru_064674 [Bulinus truncatus]